MVGDWGGGRRVAGCLAPVGGMLAPSPHLSDRPIDIIHHTGHDVTNTMKMAPTRSADGAG